jgi:hypothetical protein
MFCKDEFEVFSEPARNLIFLATRRYCEPLGFTASELVYRADIHQRILADGSRYQELTQSVVGAQGKGGSTKSPPERLRDVMALADKGIALVAAISQTAPAQEPATEANLARLLDTGLAQDSIAAGIIFSNALKTCDSWPKKADLCLSLLALTKSARLAAFLDEVLSEFFRLKSAWGPLFGGEMEPGAIQTICLSLAGDAETAKNLSPLAPVQKWLQAIAGRPMPYIAAAARGWLLELLTGSRPLASANAPREWSAMLRLKACIAANPALSVEPGLIQQIQRRANALIISPKFSELLSSERTPSRKLLMVIRLLPDVSDHDAKSMLLSTIFEFFETLDIRKEIATTSVKEVSEICAALAAAAGRSPDIPAARTAKFVEGLKIQLSGNDPNKRKVDRTAAGPDDMVEINYAKVQLKNWSPKGLLFGPYQGIAAEGDKMFLTVLIRQPFLTLNFQVDAVVVRAVDGLIAVQYKFRDRSAEQKVKAHFG